MSVMRSALLSFALCAAMTSGFLLTATSAVAEDSKPSPALPNLANRLPSVRFYVDTGRLQAIANEAGVERENSSDLGTSRREKLILNTNADQDASVQYELSTGDEQLTANIVDGQQFTISRRPAKDSHGPVVEFHQPQEGPLTLSVIDRGVVHDLKGPTIWHLLLSEPKICRQYLLPLLEMFRPEWHLAETARSVETQMLRTAGEFRPENLRGWDSLVADLASDRFADRQRAEHELRAGGAAVIPFLQGLDHRRLDYEQWSRIQHIIEAADTDEEDRPESVSSRLMADRHVWLVLLDRPDESTRRTAAGALAYLFGEPIQFDPAATESIRQRQLEALRNRVGPEAPAETK
jgi:hypothetical protein